MRNESLDHCQRCPQCELVPAIKVDITYGVVVVVCPAHGHMACGKDLNQALKHWNIYIRFVRRGAYGPAGTGRPDQSYCVICGQLTDTVIAQAVNYYRAECRACHLPKFQRGAA